MTRKFSCIIILGCYLCAVALWIGATLFIDGKDRACDSPYPLRPIILSGSEAFYNQPDYVATTQAELAAQKPLPPSQLYEFSSNAARVTKEAFSVILFPWKIYQYLHTAFGNEFFKPSASAIVAEKARPRIKLNSNWKYRRFTVLVDNKPIDAMLIGRPSTLANGRWMLVSLGIKRVYEALLIDNPEQISPELFPGLASLQQLLTQTSCNAVCYNYPGMGASAGPINREAMERAHEALLRFLEDRLCAHVIIDKGHSYGGGNQATVWSTHKVKKNVSYVLIKDRSFLNLNDAMTNFGGRIVSLAGIILGWNVQTLASSDALSWPEIHICSVKGIDKPQRFTFPSQIAPPGSNGLIPTYKDLLIPYCTSSAVHYLQHPSSGGKKVVIGVPDVHGASIQDPTVLAEAINEMLESTCLGI